MISTRMIAPVSAMKPSLTPNTSRNAIASTVSRNMPTVMKANSGSGISALMLAAPSGDTLPMLRKP